MTSTEPAPETSYVPEVNREQRVESGNGGHRSPSRRALMLEILVIIWFSLLFLFEMGISNGEFNQVYYLLAGMHRAKPELLAADWYTCCTVSYHQPWNLLVAESVRAGMLESALTAGTVLTVILFTISLYGCVRALYDEPLLPWAVALMLYAGLFTRGLGEFCLLLTSVEPSSISGALAVTGLAFLAHHQWLGAGASWGLAAFMHPNYAVLLPAMLGVASLLGIRYFSPSALLKLWLSLALLGAPTYWKVYRAATDQEGAAAAQILMRLAPHQHYPWTDTQGMLLFAAALLLGAGGLALRPPRRIPELFAAVTAMIAIVIVSLLLGSIEGFWFVNRAYLWRLSVLVMLAAVTCAAAAVAGHCAARDQWGWAAVLAGLALFALGGTARLRLAAFAAVAVALCSALGVHTRVRRVLSDLGPFALVTIAMGIVASRGVARSHVALRPMDSDARGVYAWARTHTPPASIFMVPPEWRDFRLNAERAVIADWWATPRYPPDAMEWWSRMRHLTGLGNPGSLEEVEESYKQLDCSRANFLQERYGARYVVLPASRELPCGRVSYIDGSYRVIDLGGS
jgi:hypothetical protein